MTAKELQTKVEATIAEAIEKVQNQHNAVFGEAMTTWAHG
ncbi:hypothetical protein OKN36_21630 [Furfurilactobacillus sp. OKN36]